MESAGLLTKSADKRNIHVKENVCEILELAGIKESDLNTVTQCLYSMQDHQVNDMILLEVDEDILKRLNQGDAISFRGNKHDNAMLCTQTCTYEVREAEISNSWLLVPNLKLGKTTDIEKVAERTIEKHNVKKIFNLYYEVKETKPDLIRLSSLLKSSSFNGLEYESTIDRNVLYSWERLQNELQASDQELKQALSDFLIAEIDGYLRLISFDIEARSLDLILDYFERQSWEFDEVDKENTCEFLKELIYEPVFDVIFKRYAEPSTKTKDDGSPLYRFNEEKCCTVIAKVLLATSPVTEYKEFMKTWNIGTPEKMQPREEYLHGSALIMYNTSKVQKEVISCPEADLPNNIHDRLNELFEIKAKWTVEEITPYIIRFTKGITNVNALLTKYARCSTKNGIKYYGSKHGK
ncbi:PREDICTED: sister chromatid cohesion protein DCC1 isoform X1 [Acromyrmex echinatior]|uniref:Sister chromatid cohesion protein DCC1 n=1 Tax=Acromyrmex echinatior TaxID=103372 RepID=F4WDN2_ACREC|nr:PREDICTED: sister chromatid cohesion protein DCC1 isoform X1 [Acromyrmex echinatior]EGI67693.1 Sister chromatid cohesion protein DCC1 [Acromyrmex echinatior]